MIEVKLYCDSCDKYYEIQIESISDIDWICPHCKSSGYVYITEYEDPDKDDSPIEMGRGGALHTGKQT